MRLNQTEGECPYADEHEYVLRLSVLPFGDNEYFWINRCGPIRCACEREASFVLCLERVAICKLCDGTEHFELGVICQHCWNKLHEIAHSEIEEYEEDEEDELRELAYSYCAPSPWFSKFLRESE